MTIKRGEVNPLGLLGLRKLNFIPDHFAKITVEKRIEIKSVERWIESNLNSRYAIKSKITLNDQNKFVIVLEIGLEDPKEISILSLGCQYLYKERTW